VEIESGFEERVHSMLERERSTMSASLGIEFEVLRRDRLVASMPVDHRTKQPFGILHGGASLALAETLASIGSWMNIDDSQSIAVGIEINGSHIRPAEAGRVTGTGIPVRLGRRIHVWEIRIVDDSGEEICVSRCTVAVVRRPDPERRGANLSRSRH